MNRFIKAMPFKNSIAVFGLLAFMVSCGVSQEEEAANEKRKADSLAALEAAVNAAKAAARVEAAMDSVIQAQVTDSVNSAN